MVPQTVSLLRAEDMEVGVMLVGERAALVKVLGTEDEKVLPPRWWEAAFLPLDCLLLTLLVPQATQGRRPWDLCQAGWIGAAEAEVRAAASNEAVRD